MACAGEAVVRVDPSAERSGGCDDWGCGLNGTSIDGVSEVVVRVGSPASARRRLRRLRLRLERHERRWNRERGRCARPDEGRAAQHRRSHAPGRRELGAAVTSLRSRALIALSILLVPMPVLAQARLEADGTELVLVREDGRSLRSRELVGATLRVGGTELLVASVEEDPRAVGGRVWLHRFLVRQRDGGTRDYCDPDADGRRAGFPLPDGRGGFELTCTNGAKAKCVRWGYRPWDEQSGGPPLRALHRACIHMTRADYGGTARPRRATVRGSISMTASASSRRTTSFRSPSNPRGASMARCASRARASPSCFHSTTSRGAIQASSVASGRPPVPRRSRAGIRPRSCSRAHSTRASTSHGVR